jgi:Spy/CpxP family protein refolding chaperone
MADIESGGGKYKLRGGGGGRFTGAYQFGPDEIRNTARQLGEQPPSREQFENDPKMQERFMSAYTLEHHRQLMQHPKYRAMSPRQRLAVLGYAHNQGVGSRKWGTGAMGFLDSGRVGSDSFGTKGTAYAGSINRRLGELDKGKKPGRALVDDSGAASDRVGQSLGVGGEKQVKAEGTVNVNVYGPPGTRANSDNDGPLFQQSALRVIKQAPALAYGDN